MYLVTVCGGDGSCSAYVFVCC